MLILALVVASLLFLVGLLLVPAWFLHRFLCVAHASARREMLASRQRCRHDGALRLVASSHASSH
jgi:hypothetical protein